MNKDQMEELKKFIKIWLPKEYTCLNCEIFFYPEYTHFDNFEESGKKVAKCPLCKRKCY